MPLAFKVKTTAPKLYCVRPNASIIQPGESTKISIILQGFSQPLPSDYKCKDKFLLVSLPCPELSDPARVGDAWPQLESKYKQQLVSKRLKVSYVITEGEDEDSNGNGAASFDDESHINQSQYNTSVINDTTTSAATPLRSFNGSSPSNGHSSTGFAAGAAGAAGVGAASGFAASNLSTPSKYEGLKFQDLQKEIDASNARIKELNDRLDRNLYPSTPSQAVAARAPAASSPQYADKSAVHQQQQEPEVNGISLPLAVCLMIIAFLLGWLVF